MVQALTRSLKMYVTDTNQKDWGKNAKRLTFAINTAQDRVLEDTAFYLFHGWDSLSTLEALLSLGSTKRGDQRPRK